VDECKPLVLGLSIGVCLLVCLFATLFKSYTKPPVLKSSRHGLTLAHCNVQLEDLRDTSLTLELHLSSFGPYSRFNSGYKEDKVSLS